MKEDVALTNKIHVVRMLDKSKDDPDEVITPDDMKEVFDKMKKKGSNYSFILKAGSNFRNCISQLYAKIWEAEEKPQQWRNTKIIQLYKGKGSINNLDNIRNIIPKMIIPKGLINL